MIKRILQIDGAIKSAHFVCLFVCVCVHVCVHACVCERDIETETEGL